MSLDSILLSLGWFGSLVMLVGPPGATWAPKGLSLESLWHLFGSLGMPVVAFGGPWAPKWGGLG